MMVVVVGRMEMTWLRGRSFVVIFGVQRIPYYSSSDSDDDAIVRCIYDGFHHVFVFGPGTRPLCCGNTVIYITLAAISVLGL